MSKNDKALPEIRKNLFEYLGHLDNDKDFPALKKYLQSPFFEVESRDKVIQLFDLLIRHHPNYKGNSKVTIASLNKKMRITYSANLKRTLILCIEDYLRIKRVRESEHLKVLILSESFIESGSHSYFEKYADFELQKLHAKKALNSDDYYLKYKLLFGKFKTSGTKEKVNHNALEKAINTLNYYYFYTNIINLIGHRTIGKVVKRKTDVSQAVEMVNSIINIDNISDANIKVSYFILKIFSLKELADKIEAYTKLRNIVSKHWDQITVFYRYEVYTNMLNIAGDIISRKVTDFEEEIYNIHKFWISIGTHKTYVFIDKTLFFSIIKAYCNSQKIDEAKEFIQKNIASLDHTEREQTTYLCEAYISYAMLEFSKSTQILLYLNKLDPLFEIYARILELKCWYELKNSEQFNFTYNKAYNFINRHKYLSNEIGRQYLDTILYIKKIEKARFENCFEKLKEYKKELKQEYILKERTWISKQIKYLLKS